MQSPPYRVYVRFISNPYDIRRFTVSDNLSLDVFDKMVREKYEEDYTDLPEKILYYVDQKIKHGQTITVKAEQPMGFFYDDAIITAYGMWDFQEWTFPSRIKSKMESLLFKSPALSLQ